MKIKNHQYIRGLPVRKLAELLVRSEEVNEGDEGMDGEWCDFYVTQYVTPNGSYCYDYEDAVDYTIDWLNAEQKTNP
jgi:hypothetical protein